MNAVGRTVPVIGFPVPFVVNDHFLKDWLGILLERCHMFCSELLIKRFQALCTCSHDKLIILS
jgi:hypothetical protein